MWIFIAKAGFFSVVEREDHPEQLVVRARDRDDLVRLQRHYLPGPGEILSLKNRDYPFRMYVTKEAFAAALVMAVTDIAFSNFKAETAKQLGRTRAGIYGEVWATLTKLQRGEPSPPGRRTQGVHRLG